MYHLLSVHELCLLLALSTVPETVRCRVRVRARVRVRVRVRVRGKRHKICESHPNPGYNTPLELTDNTGVEGNTGVERLSGG